VSADVLIVPGLGDSGPALFYDLARARILAWRWGSQLVEIGRAGHINGASDLRMWPAGMRLLAPFLAAA
jgi:uncharacterized protein